MTRRHAAVLVATSVADIAIDQRRALSISLIATPARLKVEFRLRSLNPQGSAAGEGDRILTVPIEVISALRDALSEALTTAEWA